MARGILVPHPGIEPVPSAVEAWTVNCWTTRKVPFIYLFLVLKTASVKPDSEYLVPEVELRVCVCVCVWFCEDITGAGSSMCESECVNICLTPPL